MPPSDKTKKTAARLDKDTKRLHYLSIWLDEPDVKAQIEVMAKAEGRSLNNYFNIYIAPKVRGVIMSQLAEKPEYLRKALEEELKAKGVKQR